MPIMKNARHEAFAQELARRKSATEAYTLAGYKSDDGHASRLARNGRIGERVQELQERSARRVELDRVDILHMLLADREMARERGQAAASIRATELFGRELCGMFTERREVSTRDDVRQLSDAELYEQLAQAVESMGEPEFAAKIRRMVQA